MISACRCPQVKAEAAAEVAVAAEAASREATLSGAADAAELYQQAQKLRAVTSSLQKALQRAADNTDSVEATAALLCASQQMHADPCTHDAAVVHQVGSDAPQPQVEVIQDKVGRSDGRLWYNVEALQLWVLKCCQASHGGLRDKPGKPPDYYHTCYCLSGLSSAQNFGNFVLGPHSNKLVKADPLCNVVEHQLEAALQHAPQPAEYL